MNTVDEKLSVANIPRTEKVSTASVGDTLKIGIMRLCVTSWPENKMNNAIFVARFEFFWGWFEVFSYIG